MRVPACVTFSAMRIVTAALAALLLVSTALAQGFERVAGYKGLGALVASTVARGPEEGSERFYLSYLYIDNTIDVVAVDPDTGQHRVFENPAPGESGARTMIVGPDGRIYLGTLPRAHILCLDPKEGTLIDLGRPSRTEQYIWDLAVGPDGKVYGATYPESKLVRYDPVSGALEDLGRMDPVEQYAHYVAGSADGFMYVGIGTSKANIAAYHIATGEHKPILPQEFQTVGQGFIYKGTDGRPYGRVGSQYFRLEGWTATPIPSKEAPPAEPRNRLADGRTVTVSGRVLRTTDPVSRAVKEQRFDYAGNDLPLFRIGFGPDGVLYGSSVLPIHFLRIDPQRQEMTELGDLGGGEIYSFLAHDKWLLMAGYSSDAPLMKFDPGKPFARGAGANPVLITYPGQEGDWRPQAFINGPDGRVYIGSVSGYGLLGGPLTVWDVGPYLITPYRHVVTDQSVVSLTFAGNMLVGGTSIGGGGGSHPTQKDAKIFLWDPVARTKVFEYVPVAGASSVNDLITAPNGVVYGLAGGRMFAFDPRLRSVTAVRTLPFSGAPYNSVALGNDGRIWGLASQGIFTIDPATNQVALEARSPEPITGGFELKDGAIYFVSGAAVYRYTATGLLSTEQRRKALAERSRPGRR